MKKLIVLTGFVVLASGCAMKQKVMDVPVVSMTHANLPEGAKLSEQGSVTGQFCADSMSDKGSIGLFDEAIKAAQNQSHADFISNASFFREGNCVTIEGTGQKIVMADTTAAPITAPKKSAAPIKKMKK